MKKKLSVLLAAALSLSLLSGCVKQIPPAAEPSPAPLPEVVEPAPETPEEPEEVVIGVEPVDFAVISGPTGVGAAQLLTNIEQGNTDLTYNYSVAASNDEITPALINGTLDIAAVATNLAANLSAKTEGGVQVLCINTLGVLYILEKGDSIHEMSDLKGKTLYAPSNTKGANPEHILNHLLEENGVEPEEVNIEWLTPQEITVKMTTEDAGIYMLPVPAATAVLLKDAGVREAISLSEAWEETENSPLPMGCIVARSEWLEENPEQAELFLQEYAQSIEFVVDEANRAEASEMIAAHGITANAAIAAKAIPQCNLTFVTGTEMQETLQDYYQVLFQMNPASIGGAMPYDSFYYGVE